MLTQSLTLLAKSYKQKNLSDEASNKETKKLFEELSSNE